MSKTGTEPVLNHRNVLNNVLQNRGHFTWLLDAHNSDHAAGVPEEIFRSIFYLCSHCGRYMTQRVSRDHHEDADWDDDRTGCINTRLAEELKAEKLRFRSVTEEFPLLSPLSRH